MKEKFAKLIDVKSIVTFAIVGTIVYLSIVGRIEPKEISAMGMMVLGFFFGTKYNKQDSAT